MNQNYLAMLYFRCLTDVEFSMKEKIESFSNIFIPKCEKIFHKMYCFNSVSIITELKYSFFRLTEYIYITYTTHHCLFIPLRHSKFVKNVQFYSSKSF